MVAIVAVTHVKIRISTRRCSPGVENQLGDRGLPTLIYFSFESILTLATAITALIENLVRVYNSVLSPEVEIHSVSVSCVF
jgi:hypothetical protein